MLMLTICMALISLSNVWDYNTGADIFIPEGLSPLQNLKYEPITAVISTLLATMLLGINMNIVKYYSR